MNASCIFTFGTHVAFTLYFIFPAVDYQKLAGLRKSDGMASVFKRLQDTQVAAAVMNPYVDLVILLRGV